MPEESVLKSANPAHTKPNAWTWVALLISLSSLAIALASAVSSRRSASIAQQALNISISTSKLDLQPELRIDKYFGNNRAPYIALINAGPVPAVHVTVQLWHLGFDPKRMRVVLAMSEGPPSFYFKRIQPTRVQIMPLDRKVLTDRFVMGYSDAPRMNEPYYNDLLEVRVRYYRESDNKAFGGRKFYFRTQDEGWVRENVSSFPREILNAVLHEWRTIQAPPFFKLNPLND
ncbi:MAG: hypothetical protein IH847_01415 [Acidobacteria bacterium]|nr:hypothetical protein [Acidobacteriota bacterium]